MTPSRSTRSSSRRSSILKPYKSNQALQTLSANNSSNESSPATTSKFKRRVSFAEKKHVKEFCNSLEQGTVWDTSYEEHDLSNLKIPSTLNHLSTNNEEIIHKGSIINHNQENYIPLASDEVIENNLNIKDCDLSKINRLNGLTNPLLNKNKMFVNLSSVISDNIQIQQNESVPSIDLQLESGNHITKSTIACNNFSEQFFDKTSKLTELHLGHHNSHNLNATSVQDIHMEFTEVVCPSMYNDIIYSKNNGLNGSLQNISMDLTQPIPLAVNMLTNFQKGQNTQKSNPQCRLNNSDTTIADQQSLMELTEVVPSIIKLSNNFNNADSLIHSVNNRTNGFDNSPMEITTAVASMPLIFCSLESSSINNKMEDHNLNLAVNSDNKTTIFHDASMEITNTIKINTNVNTNCESISEFDQLVVSKEIDFQYSDEKTKVLNTPMEMTEAIPVNMYSTNINQEKEQTRYENKDIAADNDLTKLRSDLDYYKISHDCDKTRVCNEGMEFTEIITFQNNLTDNVLVQSTSCSQRNISDKNDSINLKSNNSVQITKISPYSKKDNCETEIEDSESNISIQELVKPVLCSNTSIRETAMKRQHHSPNKNIVIDSAYVKESELLETCKNKNKNSLNHTVIHDNVLKDITNTVVPSALNSNAILDKKTYVANDFLQCSKESTINIPVSTEIENSVNSSSNIILSKSEQQNADALILEENSETNHVHNSLLNNYSSSIVTPGMNQNECLSYKQSQNIISNPRRTYTIQPLSTECPCIEENSRISSTINNDVNNDIFCHESNDKTSCTQNSSNSTNNLQNDDSVNKDVIFFNNTLEELHTISPPSFVYLDNLSDQDISTDACTKMHSDSDNIKSSETTETENASKDACNIENVNNVYEETSKIDQVVNVQIEKVNDNCSSVDVRLNLESGDSFVQEDISVKLDPFSSLISKLKLRAESDEIIWNVYYENIERNLFVIGFICSSLLVVIYLKDHCDIMDNQPIKEIKMYSRLADDADALISIVHRIIIEKLDVQLLMDLCKSYNDIFSILDYISKEVKLAMDFMFDVERISDVNLMEITQKSISFIARARRKDIILRVTVEMKPFHKIEPQNISVHCILGSVREDRVKELITNVKRDHTFLRRYINDVNEYIYIMEEFN